MGAYRTDFREYRRGQEPSDWSRLWKTDSTLGVQRHRREPARQAGIVLEHDTSLVAATWDLIDSSTTAQEVLALIRADGEFAIGIRLGGSTGSEDGVLLKAGALVGGGVEAEVVEYSSGATTSLGTKSGALGGLVWARLKANGTSVTAKIWGYGTAEPGSWDISGTTSVASGLAGVVSSSSADGGRRVYFFGAVDGAGTAPGPDAETLAGIDWSEMLDLAQIGDSPDRRLEYSAAVTVYDPDGDTEEVEWYSTRARTTAAWDLPASVAMSPMITSVGRRSVGLRDDGLGPATPSIISISFDNTTGEFDHWLGKSLAGRSLVLRAGAQGATAHRELEFVVAGRIAEEPTVEPTEASVRVEPSVDLARPLDVRRYDGIPTGMSHISTGNYRTLASSISAYDGLVSYTLMIKARVDLSSLDGTGCWLMRRYVGGGTDAAWLFTVYQSGSMSLTVGDGVTSDVVNIAKPADFPDDEMVPWVVSVAADRRYYVMVNGRVVSEGTLAVFFAGTGGSVEVNRNTGGLHFDHRIYDHYMEPDEARAESSSLPDAADPALVLWWKFDDGSGTTVTDYSSNSNHGTQNGTEGVDFDWLPTDLGDAELLGQIMPYGHGARYNARAHRIDDTRERYRVGDGGDAADAKVRSRGYELAGSAWTDEGDGVIEMAAATDDPVTVEFAPSSARYADVLEEVVTERAGVVLDDLALQELDRSVVGEAGWSSDREVSTSQFLQDYLGGAGSFWTESPDGLLAPGLLRPPIGRGPYGEPALEFLGTSDSQIRVNVRSTPEDVDTIVCWVKCHAPWRGVNRDTKVSTVPEFGCVFVAIGDFVLGTDNRGDGSLMIGIDGVAQSGGDDWLSVPGIIDYDAWLMVAMTYDGSVRRLYVAREGDSAVTLVAAESSLIGTDTAQGLFSIGGNEDGTAPMLGSIQHVAIDTGVWSETMLNDFLDEPGSQTGTTDYYFPLTEGEGPTVAGDALGNTVSAALRGQVWTPARTLDFTRYPGEMRIEGLRRLLPAWRSSALFGRNESVLSDADIAASVTGLERVRLREEGQWIRARDRDRLIDYPGAVDTQSRSPMRHSAGGLRVARQGLERMGPENEVLSIRAGRRAEGLRLCDEIEVIAGRFGLDGGKVYRVVQNDGSRLGLWR